MKMILIVVSMVLAGCTHYQWVKNADVRESSVHKIETPLAADFCTALIGVSSRACAVWVDAKRTRCVIVIAPGDGEAAAHEPGGHCMGYDHTEKGNMPPHEKQSLNVTDGAR